MGLRDRSGRHDGVGTLRRLGRGARLPGRRGELALERRLRIDWRVDDAHDRGLELEDRHLAYGPILLEPILDGPTRSSAEGPRPFEHVRLSPRIDGLEWAKIEHHSIAGRFGVHWRKSAETLTLECTIPPNTSATLELPAVDRAELKEGGRRVDEVAGLQVWSVANGIASIEVPAGTYRFTSRWK